MATVTARRRATARLPRIDARLAVGVVLIALSIVGGLRLSSREDRSIAVYVATSDLSPGHVLTRGDVEPSRLTASPAVIDGLLGTDAGPPVGRVMRQPVAAGAVVPSGALGASAPAGRRVTVPMSADHALGGAIRPGDRVDVLATFSKGTETARTITVAANAEVVEVIRTDGLFGQGEGAVGAVTLRVASDEAVVVVFAARNGDLDVVEGGAVVGARSSFDIVELP